MISQLSNNPVFIWHSFCPRPYELVERAHSGTMFLKVRSLNKKPKDSKLTMMETKPPRSDLHPALPRNHGQPHGPHVRESLPVDDTVDRTEDSASKSKAATVFSHQRLEVLESVISGK